MKIIDFHTHPYLEQVENLCMYKENFQLSTEEVKEDLISAGIHKICGSVLTRYPYNHEVGFSQISELNQKAIILKDIYGEFYEPGFHIHPAFVTESLETIEFMHANGYKLIGEIVPYMQGWRELYLDYGSKELMEILELAGEYEMIFSFHNMPQWQDQTEKMLKENPKVTFVAAHPGEKEVFLKHIEFMKKYDNLHLDISGTGLFRYGMLREGIRQVGDEKILFGTDYPIVNPRMYVQAVYQEHISENSKEKIFSKNAERILGR